MTGNFPIHISSSEWSAQYCDRDEEDLFDPSEDDGGYSRSDEL